MLRYVQRTTFSTEVQVTTAGGDKGSFVAEFTYLTRTALDELVKQELGDTELLEKILVRVSKIQDETGNELPAEAQMALVREDISLANAATRAFLDNIGGAQRGNSLKSPRR